MNSGEIKAISEYTRLNFNEVMKLAYPLFLLYRRDSWIYSMNKTEERREFLKTLWRLQQTKADVKAIHDFQQRGGNI